LHKLLGPFPDEARPVTIWEQYGTTRWDRTQVALRHLLHIEEYDYSDPTKMGVKVYRPRAEDWQGSGLEPLFAYVQEHAEEMMRPRWTFHWRFLTQEPIGMQRFGGIGPALLGTIYLTIGTMIFAVPMGVIAAIYLVEYASESRLVALLRSCISTLAGVPSIVFGLFGLAFFIDALHVSPSKSVLAGSLTMALLVLPTVIRASEEALRSVPATYREAALSLGAGRWRTIVTVLLPAAMPGVLTGIVISMGRAAGETAPIIFTAAVSEGVALKVWQTVSQGTPALSWNIYNLVSEHMAADEIRHVQYGMVTVLVLLVLLLNGAAFVLRARISRKLRG
jgi:phosphate transport system permease protein